jgi:hypothetical protein
MMRLFVCPEGHKSSESVIYVDNLYVIPCRKDGCKNEAVVPQKPSRDCGKCGTLFQITDIDLIRKIGNGSPDAECICPNCN